MLAIFRSMPSKLRVEYPGAIYHLMNRGDRRQDNFEGDERPSFFVFSRPRYAGTPRYGSAVTTGRTAPKLPVFLRTRPS